MEKNIVIEEFVSYAQYQAQFSQVFEKYQEILQEDSFRAQPLQPLHQEVVNQLMRNFVGS